MKKFVLCLLSVAFITAANAQTNAIKQYVDTYSEIAINEMMRTGVPAAITLAQGIVESQAGQSELVKSSNNHFGIKCKSEWTGDCVYHDDDEKSECFRVYNNAAESFRDHSDFLKNRPYYTSLFDINPADYKAWAKGLKKAGYATERDYPQMLVKMIEANGLQQYTLIALERIKNGGTNTFATNNNDSDEVGSASPSATGSLSNGTAGADNSHLQAAINKQSSPGTSNDDNGNSGDNTYTYPQGVFTINSKRVIYAPAGTSLLSLATKYDVSLRSILAFNELEKQDVLQDDQLIYLERKQTKSEKAYHVTVQGETMNDIAQSEGVRLENLLQYNNLQKGIRPGAGTKVYLRPQVVASHGKPVSKAKVKGKTSTKTAKTSQRKSTKGTKQRN